MNTERFLAQIQNIIDNNQFIYSITDANLIFAKLPGLTKTTSNSHNSHSTLIYIADLSKYKIFYFACEIPINSENSNSETLNLVSLSMSNTSSFIACAYNTGQIVICELNIPNQSGATSQNGENDSSHDIMPIPITPHFITYKSTHQDISSIYCLNGNEKVLILHEQGLISILALSHTETNQFIIETTIINIKTPILQFGIDYHHNVFGFSTLSEFNFIRLERQIDVILSRERNEQYQSDICFAIDVSQPEIDSSSQQPMTNYRVLIGFQKILHLYDITMGHLPPNEVKMIERKRDMMPIHLDRFLSPSNENDSTNLFLIQCFIIHHSTFLLVFNNRTAIILDAVTNSVLANISDLPFTEHCQPSNIHFYSDALYFFENNQITCRVIPIPKSNTPPPLPSS